MSGESHTLGHYRLIRKLGTGGMAEVFLAAQRMEGGVVRPVVIKAILPHLAEDDRFVKMFMREARVAAMLSHPNIVHIHDVAKLEKRPCIVMEFLKGRDLWTVMQRVVTKGEAVPPKAAATLVAQAATALDYAHRRLDRSGSPLDLVHRDISPHNLFITRDGHVKVLDFGIAKSAYQKEERTQSGVIKGKLPYMSPEQARGRDVDHRTDQFALGVVLWEMLTGVRLFARDDAVQTMTAMFHEPIPMPSSHQEVPKLLEEIVMRTLERSPTDRFDSCESLAHALRRWLASEQAGPEPRALRQLLNRAVPVTEDERFYAPDDPWMKVSTDEMNIVGKEATPSHGGFADGGRAPAPPPPNLGQTPRQRREARQRWAMIGGAGALLLGAFLVTGALVRPDGSQEVVSQTLGDAATEPGGLPSPVTVTFVGVPEGVNLEVDGSALEGSVLRLIPSSEAHQVRALYQGREVWRYDAVFQASSTVELPALPELDQPLVRPAPMREPSSMRRRPRRRPNRSSNRRGLGMGIITGYP